jgi:nucleotide-binding universal stress UspA family protein
MTVKPASKNGGVFVELGPMEKQLPMESRAPFKLKKILVPLDFSDCSKKALAYAIPYAQQFDAELVLLNVIEPYPPVPQMELVDVETIQDNLRELEILRETVGDEILCRTEVRTGVPHVEIVQEARQNDIDLIILATHGYKGLSHVFLGSTAEKVVRNAPCPVLTVRQSEREFVPTQNSSKPALFQDLPEAS